VLLQRPPVSFPHGPVAFVLSVVKAQVPRWFRRRVRRAVLLAVRPGLRGDAVQCPVCDATASGFFRGRCPSCGAVARHRVAALFLQDELRIAETGGRVLHFAPEPALGPMISELPSVDYVPGDLVPDRGQKRVDAMAIDLPRPFDGIITSHVLEHVPDDAKAMSEMFRVLRPGGWAMVMVPAWDALNETYETPAVRSLWQRHVHYGQIDHVRVYASRDVVTRLRAAGFDVEERHYAAELPPDRIDRFGLDTDDAIYLARKP